MATNASENEGRDFERHVINIARARWPQDEFGGAVNINGRERDGRFETEDAVHFVEVTISRALDKAKTDTKKLFEVVKKQQKENSMKGARGWLITKYEPTADQRSAVESIGHHQVQICSLDAFQRSIIDIQGYLNARENHFFGSVVDPATQSIKPSVEYIPLDIIEQSSDELHSIIDISEGLISGKTYVLQGDYGAGKSMTLRQIFFKLKEKYANGTSTKFPVYINLREHSGQDDPAEVIERHARKIGFSSPSSLVRAWRAGFCAVLLDGFDEITTLGASKRLALKAIRRDSVTAVRRLIEQSPGTGWILAGREHFFDSPSERTSALGLNSSTVVLSLNEFTEEQVTNYLKKAAPNKGAVLPTWLPTRPLLVGYMAARGLFQELINTEITNDAIDGWDFLIDKICEREARIGTGLDGPTLRTILERLATLARSTQDGLGPISQEQIRTTFVDVCDYEPDDQANLILQRMPGLGVHRVEEDTRSFVDADLAEICRARDVVDFILEPYSKLTDKSWRKAIADVSSFFGYLASERAARDLKKRNYRQGHIAGAFQSLQDQDDVETVKADMFGICQALSISPERVVLIMGVVFDGAPITLDEDDINLSSFVFDECFFDSIDIDPKFNPSHSPKFHSCAISELRGRQSFDDLPPNAFDASCLIERFSVSFSTQSAILETDLTKGEKIVLSLLRKLFVQSLGGRAESALSRGLDLNDRQRVPDAVRLLQHHGFVEPFSRGNGDVWIPNRKRLPQVRKLLAAPTTSTEQLMLDARSL